jgi:ferrous iron transport protein B
MASPRWTFIAIGYQCLFAYAVAFTVYQVGMFATGQGFTLATALAFLVIAAFLFLLFRPPSNNRNQSPPLGESPASASGI